MIVEIKAVERLERVHSVQLLSYLRFAGCPIGLLFNVHAGFLTRDGLKRVVNGFPVVGQFEILVAILDGRFVAELDRA